MDFVEQLKSSVDIASVIGEWVRLRKATASRYVGLCPFHSEKTPSFSVNASRQFFYCFGCHVKGDVIKFVMDIEGISFYEALKSIAERYGIAMPKRSEYADADTRRRAAVFQMHELAEQAFREHLQSPAGAEARAYLAKRGVAPETMAAFNLGYSDRSGRFLLRLLEQQRFTPEQLEESGLVSKRQDGGLYDRFRNRLMFPIHNESGKAIAFGGRALAADDEPKYLNSPETPIYKKSYVLYNLHRAKDAVRKEDRVILVEGYMDAIGVTAAGIKPVVASCGTALTTQQVQALKRHTQRIVVNFDPDAPGAKAAERSIDLLLQESMQVRIMELDGELDPDEYCKERGADAYRARLDAAKGFFYWLADRARARNDMRTSEGRVAVLQFLLPAVQRINDRLERLTVANDVAGYIGVEQGVVLEAFRKASSDRQEKTVTAPKEPLRADERGLLRVLLSGTPDQARILEALRGIELSGELQARRIYQAILALHESGGAVTFEAVDARLEEADRNLLAEMLMAEEDEEREIAPEYGEACLESLRRSGAQRCRASLKSRIKEAERGGNMTEALRLAEELQKLERPGGARR
jgi:DNA primase